MEIVDKGIDITKSKEYVSVGETNVIDDLSLQLVIEEFEYMEMFDNDSIK